MTELLERSLLLELHKTAVALGLSRKALLAGISPALVASLDDAPTPAAQILMDLSRFNTIKSLKDGSVPLRTWLETACSLTDGFEESKVFTGALEQLIKRQTMEAVEALRKIMLDAPKPQPQPPPPPPPPPPTLTKLSVLFLAANPAGRDQLAIGRELRLVEDVLLKTPDGRRISLIPVLAVTTADLQRVLLEHEPCILHFSGHGDPSGNLVLTSQLGGGAKVEAKTLGNLLEIFKSSLHCVVLNACFSELVAEAIKEHIDCVIGMSRAIPDSVAIQFAIAFYQAIAYHKDVRTAFKLACSQIDLSGLKESDIPQLLVKDGIDPNTLVLFP